MNKSQLKSKLLLRVKDGTWKNEFEKFFETEKGDQSLEILLKNISESVNVYPKLNFVFRAFNICSYEDTRVVLMGTRPFKSITANGLCFGLSAYTPLYAANPRSTNRITKTLEYKIKDRDLFLLDQSFEYWAKQGVLMLNAALTSSSKGGHMDAWAWFIINVIKFIDNEKIPIVTIGDYPGRMVNKFAKKSPVINCQDTSVTTGYDYWDVDFFNEVNKIIDKPISWH